ncbi:MAG: PfkB family carbohydrate kinase [Comamonadaceae bacterium]|nr:PfkB family carbohydrate kinase [Comamonadaceae bacterium]
MANIAPSLQIHVLNQMQKTQFVVADTMDLWLNTALEDLHELLRQVDALVLNDSEARQLSQEDNVINAALKIHRLGPKYVIVKKASTARSYRGPRASRWAPAFPLPKVIDPTGRVIRS